MPLSPKAYTWLTGLFASLGSILFGYDLGVIAAILPSADFVRVMGPRFQNAEQEGLVTSLLLLGAFFGCPLAGYLADRIGRRKCIIAGCLFFFVGGGLQTGAQNIEMMMAGRFIAGWSIGFLSFLAPLYQSEIALPSMRGSLTTLQQLMLGIGAILATWIGYGTVKNAPGTALAWRLPLGLQMLPCVPLCLCIMLFPESPRYLMLKGRHEEAIQTLARLHAHGNVDDPLVLFEYEDIKTAIREQTSDQNPVVELFTKMHYFRPMLLGIILQFSVQMTGVSAIQYYSPQIFASVGFGFTKTLLFQAYNSIVALVGEVLCVLFVDKLGRRWPMIGCNLMSCFSFAVGTALIVCYPASSSNSHAHVAFIMMTWVFNFFFSLGIGPLSWCYPVEVLPNHLRASGTAITSMAAWISNFMIAQVTPGAFANIGWRYYLVFCILSFTNALTIWALFPETKGRRLEEMDDVFRHSSWFVPLHPPAVVKGTATERAMREGALIPGTASEKDQLRTRHVEGGDAQGLSVQRSVREGDYLDKK